MKVALYILGLLWRHGPLHGYALKQRLSEEAAHFAQLKLPTIYYHLDKLEKQGFVQGYAKNAGRRPDRMEFRISEAGKEQFKNMLIEALESKYTPEFLLDAVFYFGNYIELAHLRQALEQKKEELKTRHEQVNAHCTEVTRQLEERARPFATAIFWHHAMHLEAEKAWIDQVLNQLLPEQTPEQSNCYKKQE